MNPTAFLKLAKQGVAGIAFQASPQSRVYALLHGFGQSLKKTTLTDTSYSG